MILDTPSLNNFKQDINLKNYNLKNTNIGTNLIIKKPLIFLNPINIKIGIRYYSNFNLNKRKKNSFRFIHGYNPEQFVYLSIVYSNRSYIIYDHINYTIIDSQYIPIELNSKFELIFKIKNLFKYGFHSFDKVYFLHPIKEFLDKYEVIIIIPDFLKDEDFFDFLLDRGLSIRLLSNRKDLPPVIPYIFKHFNSPKLEKKIINKMFKKKEIATKTYIIHQKALENH